MQLEVYTSRKRKKCDMKQTFFGKRSFVGIHKWIPAMRAHKHRKVQKAMTRTTTAVNSQCSISIARNYMYNVDTEIENKTKNLTQTSSSFAERETLDYKGSASSMSREHRLLCNTVGPG